jgi:hypothetical protein
MRRATLLTFATSLIALVLLPSQAHEAGFDSINAVGLVDYYRKPDFKVGDWVRYHVTGHSELGAEDDYYVTVVIGGEEDFWGEEGFWVETVTELKDRGPVATATLMSYGIFDDTRAIADTKLYMRKVVTEYTADGVPFQQLMQQPETLTRMRSSGGTDLKYYIDTLGTAQVTLDKGVFDCRKILYKQAGGASVDVGDSSRYDEVRENRTIFRSTRVPITSIAVEEIETTILRRTWLRGESADAPTNTRDRALGRAELVDWGTGREAKMVPEKFRKSLKQQRAEMSRKRGRSGAGSG